MHTYVHTYRRTYVSKYIRYTHTCIPVHTINTCIHAHLVHTYVHAYTHTLVYIPGTGKFCLFSFMPSSAGGGKRTRLLLASSHSTIDHASCSRRSRKARATYSLKKKPSLVNPVCVWKKKTFLRRFLLPSSGGPSRNGCVNGQMTQKARNK